MKTTLTVSLIAAATIAAAHPEVEVSGTRVSGNIWNFTLVNNLTGPSNHYPVYFSLPVIADVSIVEASLLVPTNWGVYGTKSGIEIDTLTYGVGVGAFPLDLPGQGGTLGGFRLATLQPSVLATLDISYGVGDMSTGQIVRDGVVLGAVPVPGTTQASGNVTLQGYVGRPNSYRLGIIGFIGSGFPSYTVAGVDERGQLLCSGPATDGIYQVSLEFPGYLKRIVSATVASGECSFSATLLPGDVDSSNIVDIADYAALSLAFDETAGGANWDERIDFTGDGIIDIADYGLLAGNFDSVGD